MQETHVHVGLNPHIPRSTVDSHLWGPLDQQKATKAHADSLRKFLSDLSKRKMHNSFLLAIAGCSASEDTRQATSQENTTWTSPQRTVVLFMNAIAVVHFHLHFRLISVDFPCLFQVQHSRFVCQIILDCRIDLSLSLQKIRLPLCFTQVPRCVYRYALSREKKLPQQVSSFFNPVSLCVLIVHGHTAPHSDPKQCF